MNWEDPPKWENMPKPRSLLDVYWEDAYNAALPIYRQKYNREPTREEIIILFVKAVDDIDTEIFAIQYDEYLNGIAEDEI